MKARGEGGERLPAGVVSLASQAGKLYTQKSEIAL